MGSFWGSIVAAVIGGIVSIFKWAFGQKQQAEGEAQGRAEQQAADATATVQRDHQEAKESNAIDQTVAGDSDAGLDAGLRQFQAPSERTDR